MKPLVFLSASPTVPPLTEKGSERAAALLTMLQHGICLGLPQSRPMPSIGARVHELHFNDNKRAFRIVYRIDPKAIVIAEFFRKTTQQTPKRILDRCRRRYARYDE